MLQRTGCIHLKTCPWKSIVVYIFNNKLQNNIRSLSLSCFIWDHNHYPMFVSHICGLALMLNIKKKKKKKKKKHVDFYWIESSLTFSLSAPRRCSYQTAGRTDCDQCVISATDYIPRARGTISVHYSGWCEEVCSMVRVWYVVTSFHSFSLGRGYNIESMIISLWVQKFKTYLIVESLSKTCCLSYPPHLGEYVLKVKQIHLFMSGKPTKKKKINK